MRQRSTVRFVLSAAVVALLVMVVGTLVADGAGRRGVMLGAGAAFAFQALAFWLLAGMLFPEKPALVYGLGMVGRFALVAAAAFLLVPALGVPAAPTLFALLTTLFVTTLLEPVFFQSAQSIGR